MAIPFKLSRYVMKQLFWQITIVLSSLTALILIIDTLELFRRSVDRDVPFWVILQMALLKYPVMGQKLMPFVMLLACVLTYTKLMRHSELIVFRSSGVSVWQFLLPAVFLSLLLGTFIVGLFNPLASSMAFKYERVEAEYLEGRSAFFAVSASGLWLKQPNKARIDGLEDAGETIVHAKDAYGAGKEMVLKDVMVLIFKEKDTLEQRIDAKETKLLDDFWHMTGVSVVSVDGQNREYEEYFLETDFTAADIQNSLASPETISFWELGEFIDTLKRSGFSALPHQLHWHGTLSSPFLYATMIFIGAIFSMRPPRQGGVGLMITASIVSAFLIYFLSNLIGSLGLSGAIPIVAAAWAPVVVSGLVGIGLLMHLEDG